jgi:predicted flap endonuclease-1-like 5' DNA nuclease
MATALKDLRGMTPEILAKLEEKGFKDSLAFLDACITPAQRKELAAFCDVETRAILELANRADLSRINGVGGAYADLLEKAGVDTVKELAQRRADNLHKKIEETNNAEKLTNNPPLPELVESWVAQAKELPKTLTY